jgi:dissimilatory sulfite reductase (desulfoviridin) alpha/beta subunit
MNLWEKIDSWLKRVVSYWNKKDNKTCSGEARWAEIVESPGAQRLIQELSRLPRESLGKMRMEVAQKIYPKSYLVRPMYLRGVWMRARYNDRTRLSA